MKSKRPPKVNKKQAAINDRVEIIGALNDQYRDLINGGCSDPQALRALAARFREEKMPNRAEMLCIEAFILERRQARKSVLNGGIIVSVGTTIGYGGTDENSASLDIPIAVSLVSDSLYTGSG